MVEKPSYRRRTYFIKKEYQFKFILKFCLIVLAGSVLSTGILFFLSRDTLTSSFENSRLTVQSTALAIMPAAIVTNLITLIVISMAAIVVLLFISHKIAGPIYRFEKELGEIAQGDLTKRITLRRKDQFTELAEYLNTMTANLREKIMAVHAEIDHLIDTAAAQGANETLLHEIKSLGEGLGRRFKI